MKAEGLGSDRLAPLRRGFLLKGGELEEMGGF